MKYVLKKDLPLAKAGTEVYLEKNSTITSKIYSNGIYDLGSIFDTDSAEWLEEVKEPKTIYDLKRGDEYWHLDTDSNIYRYTISNTCPMPTKKYVTSSFVTEREAKRNKLLRELATRTDKWIIIENGVYVNCYGDTDQWNSYPEENINYNLGLVFTDFKQYQKYMTEEAKDLLFNI